MEDLVPKPFLLNGLKHHIGYIRHLLPSFPILPEDEFFRLIHKSGNSVTDFYYGKLSVETICYEIELQLKEIQAFSPENYRRWISGKGLYYCLRISDGSDWLMRRGEFEQRYIHIHPGKYSLHTRRIKSRSLRIVLAMLYYNKEKKSLFSLEALNHIRENKLDLPPVKSFSDIYFWLMENLGIKYIS